MMRKKLSSVRQSNLAFKNMTDDQIRQYADQMELGRLMICYQSTNLLCYTMLCYLHWLYVAGYDEGDRDRAHVPSDYDDGEINNNNDDDDWLIDWLIYSVSSSQLILLRSQPSSHHLASSSLVLTAAPSPHHHHHHPQSHWSIIRRRISKAKWDGEVSLLLQWLEALEWVSVVIVDLKHRTTDDVAT